VAPSARAPQDVDGYLMAGDVRRSRHASCSYEVLVVGLGSMGAAAAGTLTAHGLRVLRLETFGAAHDQGSAHGGTRIVRQSYFEGSAYVPLLRGAYEGWHELAQESGRDLLRLCGGIYFGDTPGPTVKISDQRRGTAEHVQKWSRHAKVECRSHAAENRSTIRPVRKGSFLIRSPLPCRGGLSRPLALPQLTRH
jgi:glycine/D-amino acid oxidase-like deaminating enzyme